ncbi:hypothetical protein TWF718_004016 [Orbilia javanica]|uniref:Uncharacterized protein n=1 Tax=Orbilia javanica TaxID=47235 RepID=A0AAN8N5L5_9PEZI
MPPRRVSSFTSFDRLTSLSHSTSSSSASSERTQQVRVHSLPPGNRTHGPRRVISLESITGSQLSRSNSGSTLRNLVQIASPRPIAMLNQPSNSSRDTNGQNMIVRAAGFPEQTVQPQSTLSDSRSPQNVDGSRQIPQEGRTHVPPSSNIDSSAGNENRISAIPSDSSSTEYGLFDTEAPQRSSRPGKGFWGPDEENRARGRKRYGRGATSLGSETTTHQTTHQKPQETPRQQQPLVQSQRRQKLPAQPQEWQKSPSSPPPPPPPSSPPERLQLTPSPPLPQSSPLPPQIQREPSSPLQYQIFRGVFEAANEREFEGLEVVGLRSENGERIYADSHTGSGSSTPEKKQKAHAEEPETRITRRQNDLPVIIIPHTSMELELPNLITKHVQYPEPPKVKRLAIEYHPLEDDENDWTDEEAWHCSDGEWPDTYEYDSDEEEDFGCIGLFWRPYEEMLVAGKGFNLNFVEEVDNWPVPDEVKILGYRVIGRLGDGVEYEDEDEDEDEDEAEDYETEGVVGGRFRKDEEYKLLRTNGWLNGSDPVDNGGEDDEWEDECEMF